MQSEPLSWGFLSETESTGSNMQNLEPYPFWKLQASDRLVVRFIPDLNPSNNLDFIDEYHVHQVKINNKSRPALCSAIHEDNKPCYYCITAKKAFRAANTDSSKMKISRKYMRRKQYIGNVIVMEDPLGITDRDNPKTYKLALGALLYKRIGDELTFGKIEELPSDYQKGYNFVISRGKEQYAQYSGNFQRKSKLSNEMIALAERSEINLSTLRPTLFSSDCQDDLSKDLMWDILGDE